MSALQDESTNALAERPRDGLRLLAFGRATWAALPLPEHGAVVIGRAPDCSLRIDDPCLSRRHARVTVRRSGESVLLEVEDLGSANGTRLNGRALAGEERRAFSPGDVVDLGAVTVVVQGRPKLMPPPERIASRAEPDSDELVLLSEAGSMRPVMELLRRVAKSDIAVLIVGETGVGKEVVARELHRLSVRARRRLARVSCANFAGAERELFGGAGKTGVLDAADGGSVLLDEIADLPIDLQAKLLGIIEGGAVASGVSRRLDVRFLATSARNLLDEVKAGRLRADLYYRLNGVTLHVPPLRERRGEIAPLARAFAQHALLRGGCLQAAEIDAGASAFIERYAWPGNIRELKTTIERALVVAGGPVITREALGIDADSSSLVTPMSRRASKLEDEEAEAIRSMLERCGGNQTRAAALLGISRGTLSSRLDALGIVRPRKVGPAAKGRSKT